MLKDLSILTCASARLDPELAFHHACQEVTPQQGRNYFRAAGYKVEAELTEEDIEMVVAVQLAMQA